MECIFAQEDCSFECEKWPLYAVCSDLNEGPQIMCGKCAKACCQNSVNKVKFTVYPLEKPIDPKTL